MIWGKNQSEHDACLNEVLTLKKLKLKEECSESMADGHLVASKAQGCNFFLSPLKASKLEISDGLCRPNKGLLHACQAQRTESEFPNSLN